MMMMKRNHEEEEGEEEEEEEEEEGEELQPPMAAIFPSQSEENVSQFQVGKWPNDDRCRFNQRWHIYQFISKFI